MIRIRGDSTHIALSEPRFAGRSAWTSESATRSGSGSEGDSKPVEVRISRFVDVDKDVDEAAEGRLPSKERGSQAV